MIQPLVHLRHVLHHLNIQPCTLRIIEMAACCEQAEKPLRSQLMHGPITQTLGPNKETNCFINCNHSLAVRDHEASCALNLRRTVSIVLTASDDKTALTASSSELPINRS